MVHGSNVGSGSAISGRIVGAAATSQAIAVDKARVRRLYRELLTKPTSPVGRQEARALAPLIRTLGLSWSHERFLQEFPDRAERCHVTVVECAKAAQDAFYAETDQDDAELKLKEQERQRLTRELDRILLTTPAPPLN